MPNFTVLDVSRSEVAKLVTAMVHARDAVSRRSWSHPQEPTSEAWWADVLADPRLRGAQQEGRHGRDLKIKTNRARSSLSRAANVTGGQHSAGTN